MDDPHRITVAQAARALGVSERTVWRYLRAGRLAGETIGDVGTQRTLVAQGSVEAMLRARVRDPEAEALRAERDALAAELDVVRAERDALAERVSVLQRAVARPPRRAAALSARAAGWAMVALSRVR